jgi:hypothetical protein
MCYASVVFVQCYDVVTKQIYVECKLTPEEIETQKKAEERMDKDMWGAQVYKTPQELQRETVQQTQLQAEKNK